MGNLGYSQSFEKKLSDFNNNENNFTITNLNYNNRIIKCKRIDIDKLNIFLSENNINDNVYMDFAIIHLTLDECKKKLENNIELTDIQDLERNFNYIMKVLPKISLTEYKKEYAFYSSNLNK